MPWQQIPTPPGCAPTTKGRGPPRPPTALLVCVVHWILLVGQAADGLGSTATTRLDVLLDRTAIGGVLDDVLEETAGVKQIRRLIDARDLRRRTRLVPVGDQEQGRVECLAGAAQSPRMYACEAPGSLPASARIALRSAGGSTFRLFASASAKATSSAARAASNGAASSGRTRGGLVRGHPPSGGKPARLSSWATHASNALPTRPLSCFSRVLIGTLSSSRRRSMSGT